MKKKITLAELVFPDESMREYTAMYYRKEGAVTESGRTLVCGKNSRISFNTYFNACSYDKWKKYTNVQQIGLMVQVRGSFRLSMYQAQLQKHTVKRRLVFRRRVCTDSSRQIECLPGPLQCGTLYFELEALEDNSVWEGGAYFTKMEEAALHEVRLAVGICTYKREAYMLKNLNRMARAWQDSSIQGCIEVFVADNAGTLKTGEYHIPQTSWIHIYDNPNCGGAGGFTRCMIEARRKQRFTHMLLMDDDIQAEWSSIEKTAAVLRVLKREYQDAFLGGAMLRLDQKNIQFESGGLWRNGKTVSLHKNYDLCSEAACMRNDSICDDGKADYQAWWYCCFPMRLVTRSNLPIPCFVRGDDVEWGLRNMKTLILMNGICVWHEPFECKHTSWMRYYDIRNTLINHTCYGRELSRRHLLLLLAKEFFRESCLHQYRCMDFFLQGVLDFLKGTSFLAGTDARKLHEKLMAQEKQASLAQRDMRAFAAYGMRTLGTAVLVCVQLGSTKKDYRKHLAGLCTLHMWKQRLLEKD